MNFKTNGLEKAKKVYELLDIQATDGNWNYDPYMLGKYNGMELIISIIENRDPKYKDAPSKWLKENKTIKELIQALKKDKDYYYGWQADIAMAFFDEMNRSAKRKPSCVDLLKISNQAAENFLNLLIGDGNNE